MSEYKGKINIDTTDLRGGAEALKSFQGAMGLVSQAMSGDLVGAAGRAKEALGSLLETFTKYKTAGIVGIVAAVVAGGFKLYENYTEKILARTKQFTDDMVKAQHELQAAMGWNLTPEEQRNRAIEKAAKSGNVGLLAAMESDARAMFDNARADYNPEDKESILKLAEAARYKSTVRDALDEALKAHAETLQRDTEALEERLRARQDEVAAADKNAEALNKQAAQVEESTRLKAMKPLELVDALNGQIRPLAAAEERANTYQLGSPEDRAAMRLELAQLRQQRDAALEEAARESEQKDAAQARAAADAAKAESDMAGQEADYRNTKLGKTDPAARRKEIGDRLWELENSLEGDPTLAQRKEHLDLLRELDQLDAADAKPKPTKERGSADVLQDLRDAAGAGRLGSGPQLSHRGGADRFRAALGDSFAAHLQAGELTRSARPAAHAYQRADTRAEQLAQEHTALLKRLVTVTEERLGLAD